MDDRVNGADRSVRVSDADRAAIADRLARAQAEGRLDLSEFEQRVRAAYAAVIRADLAPLTADLPADAPVATAVEVPAPSGRSVEQGTPRVEADAGRSPRRGLAAAAAAWATVSALNLAVWVVVALAVAGPVYPWWIWVAGPWGVVLAVHALAGRSGSSCARALAASPGWPCGARLRR